MCPPVIVPLPHLATLPVNSGISMTYEVDLVESARPSLLFVIAINALVGFNVIGNRH